MFKRIFFSQYEIHLYSILILRFKKLYKEIKKNGLYCKKIPRKDFKCDKRMLNQERIISFLFNRLFQSYTMLNVIDTIKHKYQ